MRHSAQNRLTSLTALAALVGALILAPAGAASAAEPAMSVVEKGKAIAFDRKKGNCLACHAMDDGTLPGNIAPPLISMKLRYPDKQKLHDQIWDATVANPNTIMPPFGRHRIISEEEIDQVVEYVYTL
jgi:sulfur-oxidizing protein SoxX